jgi:molybdenum cofactor cytidylyltransferase
MNAIASLRLRIVILAAGLSSRLGRPKALARVRGASLLRKALLSSTGLSAGAIVVVVPRNSVRYRIEARGIKVDFAVNPLRALGLASSVRRGIRQARYSSALLLMPVDLVNLRRRDLAHLISRWQAAPRRVIARRIGQNGGTPLILPRWLYARALCIEGDVGLRELLGQLTSEARVLIDMPAAELDLDTPSDLQAARRRRQLGQCGYSRNA